MFLFFSQTLWHLVLFICSSRRIFAQMRAAICSLPLKRSNHRRKTFLKVSQCGLLSGQRHRSGIVVIVLVVDEALVSYYRARSSLATRGETYAGHVPGGQSAVVIVRLD